jgi:hypothetical protein
MGSLIGKYGWRIILYLVIILYLYSNTSKEYFGINQKSIVKGSVKPIVFSIIAIGISIMLTYI